MSEDPHIVALAALAFLDKARSIGVHAGESFPERACELGLADAAVIVGVHPVLPLGTPEAADHDAMFIMTGGGGQVNDPWAAFPPGGADDYLAKPCNPRELMSYGIGTAYVAPGWRSWLSAPIYGATGETPYDLDTSVRAYVATGVPRSKIGIGIGFYGMFYSPDITAPRQALSNGTYLNADDNALAYNELRENGYLTRGTYHWDAVARVGYRTYRPR